MLDADATGLETSLVLKNSFQEGWWIDELWNNGQMD